MKHNPEGVRRLVYRDFKKHDHIDVEAFEDRVGLLVARAFETGKCVVCAAPFSSYRRDPVEFENMPIGGMTLEHTLQICPSCGWWQLRADGLFKSAVNSDTLVAVGISRKDAGRAQWAHQYHGVLKSLNLASDAESITEIKEQLLRRWGDRKYISPGAAERLVADVLKDYLSCDVVHVTGNPYAPDGGLDLYVCSKGGSILKAVQVKRRQREVKEAVSEVRNFIGALVIEGYSAGIFVTTARSFTRQALALPRKIAEGQSLISLSLIDGDRLLELLRHSHQPCRVNLPEILSETMVWRGTDGHDHSTHDLLFGLERS